MKQWHLCYRSGNLESQIAFLSVRAQHSFTPLTKRKLNLKVFTFQILKDGKGLLWIASGKKKKASRPFFIYQSIIIYTSKPIPCWTKTAGSSFTVPLSRLSLPQYQGVMWWIQDKEQLTLPFSFLFGGNSVLLKQHFMSDVVYSSSLYTKNKLSKFSQPSERDWSHNSIWFFIVFFGTLKKVCRRGGFTVMAAK